MAIILASEGTDKENSPFTGSMAVIPGPVMTEIEKAKIAPRLFDPEEIWSRSSQIRLPLSHRGRNRRYFYCALGVCGTHGSASKKEDCRSRNGRSG